MDALDLDQSSGEHVQLLVVVVKLADLATHAGRLAVLDQRGGGLEILQAARIPSDDLIVSKGGGDTRPGYIEEKRREKGGTWKKQALLHDLFIDMRGRREQVLLESAQGLEASSAHKVDQQGRISSA